MALAQHFTTHDVQNQPEPLPALNLYTSDEPLRGWVAANGGDWAARELEAFGAVAGGENMRHGELANRHRPELRLFDGYGRRRDEVEFHPAYHSLMQNAMRAGVHSFSWQHEDRAGAHVVRAALLYLNGQADSGTSCPLTMTHAVVPTLRRSAAIAKEWVPRVIATEYDPRAVPASQKTACTMGMGMTEKQGGSDVRANTTRAERQSDGSYALVGHKWFFSAPMCDAHVVLAKTEAGLGCFLVPRLLPDGSLNGVRIQRLKDKLGDWSNASSEVEFQGAQALLVGEEGRGVPTIIEMVKLTRLDCIMGSASLMRQALVQALHHARQRRAFGRLLLEQPLMRNVLADLALESEAAVALGMRVARAVDGAHRDAHEAAVARITTAIGKYWVCKRTPPFVNEAQECLGGIGYVEESILPRLYRQAPLNSIWEGSGNVQCLDVLRALQKEPDARDALMKELGSARGQHASYDGLLQWLSGAFDDVATLETRSRLVVERAALALQASCLIQGGRELLAGAFVRARLDESHGLTFGTLDAKAPIGELIERAMPQY